MPVDTQPQTQDVQGPDGKTYKFSKGITPARIDKYFTKQGWIKKDGQWYTQTGEAAKKGLASGIGTKSRPSIAPTINQKAVEDIATGLPSAGGLAGGILGGGKGPIAAATAGLGGAIGEDLRQMIMRPILLGRGQQDLTAMQSLQKMGTEAASQAAQQYGGEKAGEYFFKLLDKIPHSVIKKGIPLLPSDLNPNSRIMKYVENLLSNLVPSAGTMAAFKEKQSAAVVDKASKIAKGFAKFDGNSEEMGILLQKALEDGKRGAETELERLRKTLPQGKQTMKDFARAFPNELQDFQQTYANELSRNILKENKPELIAGWLRTPKAGLNDTRIVTDVIHELKPDVLGKVQNRILRDVINETLTGSKDPTAKGVQQLTKQYSGNKFKQVIDSIGEEKLKAIYGQEGYKRIEDFVKLTGNVGSSGQGMQGGFLNLIFFIPFRSGMGVKSMAKVAATGIFANRMAKIITSPEGMKAYENGIRAFAQNAPRGIDVFRKEMTTLSGQADLEYQQEEQEAEQEYNKEKTNK